MLWPPDLVPVDIDNDWIFACHHIVGLTRHYLSFRFEEQNWPNQILRQQSSSPASFYDAQIQQNGVAILAPVCAPDKLNGPGLNFLELLARHFCGPRRTRLRVSLTSRVFVSS